MPSERPYVIDTHALLWFFSGDRRLSRKARELIDAAADGAVSIGVSTISLAEALIVIEKRKVRLSGDLLELIDRVDGFGVMPFDLATFQEMARLPSKLEIHDRAIAATCRQYDATLITRDAALAEIVRAIW